MRIESIKIERMVDHNPDLSYLGTYSDSPEEYHIDRKSRGDWERNQYLYFNLGCGDPEYLERDYDRVESYNRDEWGMFRIRAEAKIVTNGVIQTITSAGLWGIESDSDEKYFDQIEGEKFEELEEILKEMGFAQEEINSAQKQIAKL